ncbi:MAG: hypothetical protein BGP07_05475 [Rhizobiales bacterium 63-22]|nr:MAG: hypothetical protein BGP07_05475 [Rhizobiales bacterium 63-22]
MIIPQMQMIAVVVFMKGLIPALPASVKNFRAARTMELPAGTRINVVFLQLMRFFIRIGRKAAKPAAAGLYSVPIKHKMVSSQEGDRKARIAFRERDRRERSQNVQE